MMGIRRMIALRPVAESLQISSKKTNLFGVCNRCYSAEQSHKTIEYKSGETHFGYQTVPETEKEKKVYKVFEDVARSYDMMNDVTSLGIHRIWKDVLIERLAPFRGTRLLDVAGGTGDVAFRFLKYLKSQPEVPGQMKKSHVTLLDINQNMLDVGKARAKQLGYEDLSANGDSMEWVCGDAENLPFEDNSFNAYTISFGVRNCTHVHRVLAEAYRVLQPGGRFLCLEFSHLTNDFLQYVYDQYSFQIIPPMGQILAGNWHAYQYLVESIRKFPNQETFKKMIEDEGFRCVNYENLTFGIVSIHSGFKLE